VTFPVKPSRGGFTRPFGCAWFIREFLLGHSPYGSPGMDPKVGAPQAVIYYHYKHALRRSVALDAATRDEERQAAREKRSIDPDQIDQLLERYLKRLPYKAWRCRYHSYIVYFSNLRRLKWVEATGQEKTSSFQRRYPPGPPRIYYRLTTKGRQATDDAWRNPLRVLYGHRKKRNVSS
jgi:hypothetical protein